MLHTVTRIIQWISIPVLLLASIFARYAASYELLVNLVVCMGAVVGVQRAVRLRNYFWAAAFVAVAVVFSPFLLITKIVLLMGLTCIATCRIWFVALRARAIPESLHGIQRTAGPPAMPGVAADAAILQEANAPLEWKQGGEAYGQRVGSMIPWTGIHSALACGLDSTPHQDPRHALACPASTPRRFPASLLICLLLTVPPVFAQDVPVQSPKDIANDIVRDQKQIWTSPFRIKRQNAKWWLIFGAATGALIATDHLSSRQLPNTGSQVAFSRNVSQLGAVYTLVPLAGGLYLTGALSGQSKLRDTGLLGGEAMLDSLIVSEVLKAATGRQRPLEGDGGGHFFHGGDGFPSGHTIGSFAFASVIAHQYRHNKPVVILAYGLATLVGASRFSARQHSASDVVAAGIMGWFIGTQVAERRTVSGRSPVKARLLPKLVPQVEPSSHSYGVLLAWHP